MSSYSGFSCLFCPVLDINMLYISRINTLPVDEKQVTGGIACATKGPVKSINGNPRSLEMKKQQNRSIFRMLTIIINVTVLQAALADGYRNPPPTAEGIAKSGVNSVFVDDASAIAYNPANLTSRLCLWCVELERIRINKLFLLDPYVLCWFCSWHY